MLSAVVFLKTDCLFLKRLLKSPAFKIKFTNDFNGQNCQRVGGGWLTTCVSDQGNAEKIDSKRNRFQQSRLLGMRII